VHQDLPYKIKKSAQLSMHACRLIVIPVNKKTLRLTPSNVLARVTARTAIVVASAPSYPHGIIDDIAGIANVAARCRICMHVDACLGGFVLPFMRHLRYEIPPFDFSLPGVTSMSADTHKYGLAHKGTSVVLYRNKVLRRAQFTPVTEWSGGFYVSPGLSGSRCGAAPFSPHISVSV
jgi:sphinganine-1-phosphate aldolase